MRRGGAGQFAQQAMQRRRRRAKTLLDARDCGGQARRLHRQVGNFGNQRLEGRMSLCIDDATGSAKRGAKLIGLDSNRCAGPRLFAIPWQVKFVWRDPPCTLVATRATRAEAPALPRRLRFDLAQVEPGSGAVKRCQAFRSARDAIAPAPRLERGSAPLHFADVRPDGVDRTLWVGTSH